MSPLAQYVEDTGLPGSEAGRISLLLGMKDKRPVSDIMLADRVAEGLAPSAADALGAVLGPGAVVGRIIPEATLRRARKTRRPLSREMSERLYEVGRVVDAVSRAYHGDQDAVTQFLNQPHPLLANRSPLDMARSSSAGADAVLNLLRRADYGFAV